MKFKKTLIALGLASAIGLGLIEGCNKSQESIDEIAKDHVYEWIERYAEHMEVYKHLTKEDYKEAESILRGYLKEDIKKGDGLKYLIYNKYKVSEDTKERIENTIEHVKKEIEYLLKSDHKKD